MAKSTKSAPAAATATKSAAQPKAPASAAPGTSDAAGAKTKVKKVDHPSLVGPEDDEGKPTRLKINAVPEDFDKAKHNPIKKADFETDGAYLRMRADQLEAQAKKFRGEADMADKMGSRADRAKAKKLLDMQSKMAELTKQLEAAGVDVEALTAD